MVATARARSRSTEMKHPITIWTGPDLFPLHYYSNRHIPPTNMNLLATVTTFFHFILSSNGSISHRPRCYFKDFEVPVGWMHWLSACDSISLSARFNETQLLLCRGNSSLSQVHLRYGVFSPGRIHIGQSVRLIT